MLRSVFSETIFTSRGPGRRVKHDSNGRNVRLTEVQQSAAMSDSLSPLRLPRHARSDDCRDQDHADRAHGGGFWRIAATDNDGARVRRFLALSFILERHSCEKAARHARVDRQTLRHGVHRYNKHGVEGLCPIRIGGRSARSRHHPACGPQWVRSATLMTTRCAKASSRPWSASCWNVVGSRPRQRPKWPASALLKAGTIPSGCIPRSVTGYRSPMTFEETMEDAIAQPQSS